METQTGPLNSRAKGRSFHWLPQALLCAGALVAAGVLTIEARLGPLAARQTAQGPGTNQIVPAGSNRPASPTVAQKANGAAAAPPALKAVASAPPAVAPTPQKVAATPAAAVSAPRPTMSEADLKQLAVKAAQALKAGDIGGARMVLERAASAGDPSALFALGETYDPSVLRKMRVRGLKGDIKKARALYRKASDDGVLQAKARLATLNAARAPSSH
ncbi:MAG TPA: hypothetical protein VMU56_08625 [Beijerinckiaceae bacterium]|nr:hypothetical protein [Beijerinckiaceae bacterium]HVB89185.1 hypothetical protein [Beijerinckiaceae bacterium]